MFRSAQEHDDQRRDRGNGLALLTNDFLIRYRVRSEADTSAQTNYRTFSLSALICFRCRAGDREKSNLDDRWRIAHPDEMRSTRFSSNRGTRLLIARLMGDLWPMIQSTLPLLFVSGFLTFDCSLSPSDTSSSENQTQLALADHRQEMYCVKMHVQLFPSVCFSFRCDDVRPDERTGREMIVCIDFVSLLTMLSICWTAFRPGTSSSSHLLVMTPFPSLLFETLNE